MEDFEVLPTNDIRQKCLAFQEDCPFGKGEESQLNEAIEKCPEFKDGCPFTASKSLGDVYEKLSHVPHSAENESESSGQKVIEDFKNIHDTSECLEEELGDCPVFHKDQGCPIKSVCSEDGKHLIEPPALVISPVNEYVAPIDSKAEILEKGVHNVKESCPAFKESCPFSDIAKNSDAFKNAKNCPKLKDGCAFKECRSLNDIYSQLKEIPDLEEEQGSHGDVLASLKMLHEICVDLEKQIGECPVFATEMGCPFKTVCGDGRLMVAKMEENLPSNVIGEVVREEKNTMERELLASSGTAFYQELKERTKEKHRVTNSRPFIKHLIKGKVNIAVYKLLLSNLYFLYRTLEEEGDKHQSHPKLKPLYFPVQLRRLPEIIKDLEFHYGSDWKDQIRPLEAMEHYVARLVQLSEEDPMLLAAHQYLRYMGDLAGGQILKKIYSKTYNLSDSDGIHFHEFQNIPDQDEFKKLYRSRLDSLHLGREDADRMVDETLKGYDFHIQLFAELAELCDINPKPQVEVDAPPAHEAAVGETSEIPLLVGRSLESNSTGTQFVVFGVVLALFAILYALFLA